MESVVRIRIGRLFGIPIIVDGSWLLIFGLVTFILAREVYPQQLPDSSTGFHVLIAGFSALLFFVSIILHELAHSVVAKAYKIPVKSITLFLFGGVAQITRDATKPISELLMAAAGPATSLVLGVAFIGAWFALGGEDDTAIGVLLAWLGVMNVALAVFNMLPAFPMDGGRVFRSLAWLITGNYYRATTIAAWTGRLLAWVAIGLGGAAIAGVNVFIADDAFNGLWLIFVGLFIENAARQSLLQNQLLQVLSKYSARDLMIADPPVVDSSMSVASLARGVLEINPRVCYFVEEHGALAGIISSYQLRAVPEAAWDRVTAAEAMLPKGRLKAVPPERRVNEVLVDMDQADLTHLPVVDDGRVVGVIPRDRILNVLRQAGLLQ